jgi:hypothetical protein
MSLPEAVVELQCYGYPRRHAAFLACVLAHGGYFLRRQLLAASGRPDGAAITKFLRLLIAQGYVRRATYARRTQLYHLRHPFFYEALGDPDSPFQRRAGLRATVRRLMTVDTILAFPDAPALGPAEEKRDYFVTRRGVREGLLPVRWDRHGRHGPRCIRRLFPDRTPILIEPDGEGVVLVYVQGLASSLDGWTTWLETYAPVMSSLPRVRVVFATVDPEGFGAPVRAAFARWQSDPQAQVRARATRRAAALRRYFQLRRQVEWMAPRDVSATLRATLNAARRGFTDDQYDGTFERWKLDGEALIARYGACPEGVVVAHVALLVHHIAHRYDCFGTLVAESLRAPVRPRSRHPARRPPRIDSARDRSSRAATQGPVRNGAGRVLCAQISSVTAPEVTLARAPETVTIVRVARMGATPAAAARPGSLPSSVSGAGDDGLVCGPGSRRRRVSLLISSKPTC